MPTFETVAAGSIPLSVSSALARTDIRQAPSAPPRAARGAAGGAPAPPPGRRCRERAGAQELVEEQPAERLRRARVAREQRALDDLGGGHAREDRTVAGRG